MSDETAAGRAWLRRARANGHDALGIANSPETLRTLAEVSRERFLGVSHEHEDLGRWASFTVAVATLPHVSSLDWRWVLVQLALLRCLPETYNAQSARAQLEQVVAERYPEGRNELAKLGELTQQVERLLAKEPTPILALVFQALGTLRVSRAEEQDEPVAPLRQALTRA